MMKQQTIPDSDSQVWSSGPEPVSRQNPGRFQSHKWRSLGIIYVFIFLCFLILFAPVLRFDSLKYIEVSRSLVFDGDMNIYNEDAYFTTRGWADISKRSLKRNNGAIIDFMDHPEFTRRGYFFVFFPVGPTIFWLPPIVAGKFFYKLLPILNTLFSNDGYSAPYVLLLSTWNLMWWLLGIRIAFRIICRFYPRWIAIISIITVVGAGNILPFVSIDVCFSHALDFFLVTLLLSLWFSTQDSNQRGLWFFMGAVTAYSVIVRYQDIAFALIPVLDIFRMKWNRSEMWNNIRELFRRNILFAIGFLPVIALQAVFWKIIHGEFILSAKNMGSAAIPTFNLMKPHLRQMFFSEFHGLVTWMPLIGLGFAGFFIFALKNPGWGIPLSLLLLIETYYNSCRTEWWNLGFSVRRFSGFGIFFMLGLAAVISSIRFKRVKLILIPVVTLFMLWNVLFMIQFYGKDRNIAETKAYQAVVADHGAYGDYTFKWVGPRIAPLKKMLKGTVVWIKKSSWVGRGIQTCREHFTLLNLMFLLMIPLLFGVSLSGALWLYSLRKKPKLTGIAGGVLLIFFAMFLILSDMRTETIQAVSLNGTEGIDGGRIVRIRSGAPYWGENKPVNWDEERFTVHYTQSDTFQRLNILVLDTDAESHSGKYHLQLHIPGSRWVQDFQDRLYKNSVYKVNGFFGLDLLDQNLWRISIDLNDQMATPGEKILDVFPLRSSHPVSIMALWLS